MIKADYFICPDCGAEVRVGSRGCARCASDRATKAWEQDEVYDGLDLPGEEEFDYQDFVDTEFRGGRRKSKREWMWWATAVLLLISLVAGWVAWSR